MQFLKMAKKELSLILDKELLRILKKDASKKGISIEEYVIKVLEGINNV